MGRRIRNPTFLGWALLAAAILVAAAMVFRLERGLTFGWDEFVWIEIGGLSEFEAFIRPYGGHLILTPYLIFRGAMDLFGISFTAFAAIQVVGLSLVALLLYVYSRRRVGPILALAPAVVILFLGGAYPVLFEPMIGIQFLAAIAPGLAAIVVLEREDLAGDLAACLFLCLALAGFSEGAIFLAGAVASIAVSRNWKRRLWVVVVPLLGYLYWRHYASQFETVGVIGSNIPPLPSYFVDALAVYASAVFGQVPVVGIGPFSNWRLYGYQFGLLSEGVAILLIETIAVFLAFLWAHRRGALRRTIVPPLVMLAALFVELDVILVPGRTAAEPRYLYAGVLILLLVVVELARGLKATRTTVAVVFALTAAAVVGNLARAHDARTMLHEYSVFSKADMTVIELAGADADQYFTPNQGLARVVPGSLILNTGPWLAVVDKYNSVAFSVPELRAQAEDVRVQADRVAKRALLLRLEPVAAAAGRGCREVAPGAAATSFALPPGGAVLRPRESSTVSLRRWADEFAVDLSEVEAGQAVRLAIPPDEAADVPWRVRLQPAAPVTVCPIR